jgi:hypothetical protein
MVAHDIGTTSFGQGSHATRPWRECPARSPAALFSRACVRRLRMAAPVTPCRVRRRTPRRCLPAPHCRSIVRGSAGDAAAIDSGEPRLLTTDESGFQVVALGQCEGHYMHVHGAECTWTRAPPVCGTCVDDLATLRRVSRGFFYRPSPPRCKIAVLFRARYRRSRRNLIDVTSGKRWTIGEDTQFVQ